MHVILRTQVPRLLSGTIFQWTIQRLSFVHTPLLIFISPFRFHPTLGSAFHYSPYLLHLFAWTKTWVYYFFPSLSSRIISCHTVVLHMSKLFGTFSNVHKLSYSLLSTQRHTSLVLTSPNLFTWHRFISLLVNRSFIATNSLLVLCSSPNLHTWNIMVYPLLQMSLVPKLLQRDKPILKKNASNYGQILLMLGDHT